jgi:predicted AlkP superfamily pyrophosphatase or phosphodiesterase
LKQLPVIAAALFAAACAGPRSAAPVSSPTASARTVVVVSFDALGDAFLDRDTLPNFARLMRDGVRAPARPEFPSKTFPNHYSMATGLAPGHHGIVLNQFFDPKRDEWFRHASQSDGSWFGGEPIWVSAEHAGLRTAAYFWMGSEAQIDGVRPTYWKPFDATVSDDAKLNEIMRWLRLPEVRRPRLIMMYSPVVDIPGHRYGPAARQTYAAVRAADAFLGRLRDSLGVASPNCDLIIVSDHGLVAVPREHGIDMDSRLPARGALVDDEHATFSLWQDPAGPKLDLDSIANAWRSSIPHMRLFQHGGFPVNWLTAQNPRFGDIFLLADPGYEFVGTMPPAIYTLGEHGYDPATPEMTGIFLAAGPDFRSGVRLDARENRSLHDLLVTLLHLNVPRTTSTTDFGLRH